LPPATTRYSTNNSGIVIRGHGKRTNAADLMLAYYHDSERSSGDRQPFVGRRDAVVSRVSATLGRPARSQPAATWSPVGPAATSYARTPTATRCFVASHGMFSIRAASTKAATSASSNNTIRALVLWRANFPSLAQRNIVRGQTPSLSATTFALLNRRMVVSARGTIRVEDGVDEFMTAISAGQVVIAKRAHQPKR